MIYPLKVVFGRKSTGEESYYIFSDYLQAVNFIKAWTANPDNYANKPIFVKHF